jgi:hypothetical protein
MAMFQTVFEALDGPTQLKRSSRSPSASTRHVLLHFNLPRGHPHPIQLRTSDIDPPAAAFAAFGYSCGQR